MKQTGADQTDQQEWVTVHRVVLPTEDDPSVLPLYIDWREVVANVTSGRLDTEDEDVEAMRYALAPVMQRAEYVPTAMTRRSITVPAYRLLSFATYFNAFPAAYWRRWTTVDQVRLSLHVDAAARVDVFRSTSRGTFNRIAGAVGKTGQLQFDLSLRNFGDGGWLWFEVHAHGEPVTVSDAEWSVVAGPTYRPQRLSMAITTFNRPDDCVQQMRRVAAAPELLARLDTLLITDQGSQPVSAADGYADAAAELGDQFRLIEQGNLGGSGGFARGMVEAMSSPNCDCVLLMDDDVVVETEGILRAVQFSDFAAKPMLVGGQMLNLYERATVSSWGEHVDYHDFAYKSVLPKLDSVSFLAHPLRSLPDLHRRVDVDYNAWWMCLIPRVVIEDIGLSLPVFIKWDDVEYGLRARRHGYATVTLPGAAVWHMPWTEKDDSTDWQAYFHQRNRWLAALLYAPGKGAAFPRISFAIDVRHLLSMQYATVALRLRALEDLLSGPAHMHEQLPTINADVRRMRGEYTEARVISDPSQVSEWGSVQRQGMASGAPESLFTLAVRAGQASAHSLVARPQEDRPPQTWLAAKDATWWRLAAEDSAVVSTADGGGFAVHRRDRRKFAKMLARSARLHAEVMRQWPKLRAEYRAAQAEFTSAEAWQQTFARSTRPTP